MDENLGRPLLSRRGLVVMSGDAVDDMAVDVVGMIRRTVVRQVMIFFE
jgi:hypothetical protein